MGKNKQKTKIVTNEKLRGEARSTSLKRIIMFDLDGTLTKSKANLDGEMAALLCGLLEKKIVAVVSGGNYTQFQKQFLDYLKCSETKMKNLFILPTPGASLYKYQKGGWRKVYKHTLTPHEREKILTAFQKAFRDINYISPKKIYGKVIEDRESQVTFSALGQKAPLAKREGWNKKFDVRIPLKAALEKYLPEFEIRLGGLTSIDVTKKGIDKAYGISRILKMFARSKKEIVYVGDALYEGGNDYVVKSAGIDTIAVKDEEDTKILIRFLLSFFKK